MKSEKKFDYFIVSKELLEFTEPIEESLRERNQSVKNSNKFFKDFWIINLEEIFHYKNEKDTIYKTFKNSEIYKKLEIFYLNKKLSKNLKGFVLIISSDKIFVDWMNLKIPDLEKFDDIFTNLRILESKRLENVIGISGNGKFVNKLIKKDQIWDNSRFYI